MAKNKTVVNKASVEDYLNGIEDVQKKADCFALMKMMKDLTKEEPRMWGETIVGFGAYHYKYESGREGDMFLTGFSPRKQNITVYVMAGFESFKTQLEQLGKFKIGKSCLYFKKIEDIDQEILHEMIVISMDKISKKYG